LGPGAGAAAARPVAPTEGAGALPPEQVLVLTGTAWILLGAGTEAEPPTASVLPASRALNGCAAAASFAASILGVSLHTADPSVLPRYNVCMSSSTSLEAATRPAKTL
jgi:hypothetical protein